MRDQGTPRFDNDDYSHFAGADYHERSPRANQSLDDRIIEKVWQALREDPTVNTANISVKVQDGIVTLIGKARDRREKRIAEMILVEIAGVLDVRNEIELF